MSSHKKGGADKTVQEERVTTIEFSTSIERARKRKTRFRIWIFFHKLTFL